MVFSRRAVLLAVAALLQTATVQAQQAFQPPGNSEMAYASIPDTTLYIQGGFDSNYTNSFYSLDLTQNSWLVSSPPWTNRTAPTIILTPTSRASISNGMTVTRDQKRLVIWAEPGVFWMDIATGLWQSEVAGNVTTAATMRYNYRRAATHGDTGLIYIPGGADQGTKMVVLDPETFAVTTVDMPSVLLPGIIGLYGWVWSDLRKSFLMTGGELLLDTDLSQNQNIATSLEYFPGNNTWTRFTTNGADLPLISRHCMVQGYGGRKIVVYGGHEWNQGVETLRGTIFVLDVPTMTWVQGDSVAPTYVSSDSACTLTGTNFISWGGSQAQLNKATLATPVIFDVESKKWIAQFQNAASAPGVDGGTSKGAGGVASVVSPQTPSTYNINTQQDYFKTGPESGRAPYSHYQNGHVSSLNVRDPPTVQTIPFRNPQQIVNVYSEFPNDNVQRHPQATSDTLY
ncbi:hypothetical protein KI688_005724 [Linnemannia hyalina]|uniref:Galactose oxidase n=1 Tax=Linnemannia hyalina TaxID=64524 RepID=A0A9P7Y3N4_9FUNG|nr:hypothetical protein KI688_005724 [Linnemannia hyalina]